MLILSEANTSPSVGWTQAVQLWACLFLATFGPRIHGIDLLSAACFAAAGHLAFRRSPSPLLQQLAPPLSMLFALILTSIPGWASNEHSEVFHFIRALRAIINVVGVVSIAQMYLDCFGPAAPRRLLSDFIVVVSAHSLVMVSEYTVISFRQTVYDLIDFHDSQGNRVPGLTISYGCTGLTHGMALWVLPIILRDAKSNYVRIVWGMQFVLIGWSMSQLGRTAFFLMLLLWPLILLATFKKKIAQGFVASATLCTVAGVGALLCGLFLSEELVDKYLDGTIAHLMEPLRSYEDNGEMSSGSTDRLQYEMLFLPEDKFTLVFGCGISGRGDSYIPSDSGYVLNIYGVGVAGVVASLIFYLSISVLTWKFRGSQSEIAIATILFNASVILYHIKESTLLTRHVLTVTALFACMQIATAIRHSYSYRDYRSTHPRRRLAA